MPGVPVLESPDDVDRLRTMEVGADDFICTSWHPAGTCQPGDDPEYSVVDFNHECHDIDRLFIADASTLPGPPAVNTQITVMAFANRAAERIADRV